MSEREPELELKTSEDGLDRDLKKGGVWETYDDLERRRRHPRSKMTAEERRQKREKTIREKEPEIKKYMEERQRATPKEIAKNVDIEEIAANDLLGDGLREIGGCFGPDYGPHFGNSHQNRGTKKLYYLK